VTVSAMSSSACLASTLPEVTSDAVGRRRGLVFRGP
jgi:hypothetical protein